MSTVRPSLVPRLVPGVDIRRLPIGPQEAFVLSRIDGNTTVRDIGYATGMLEEQVEQCLLTLENAGAVDYAERPYAVSRNAPPLTTGNVSGPPPSPAPGSSHSSAPPCPVPLYDPAELNTHCDLELERRRSILDLYYQLGTLDHYRLLGLAHDADRKATKSAYYERVKIFHPDRYYGKNLGEFRSKLEKCFTSLTDAYETLVNADSRAEYDGYLRSQQQAVDLERSLNQSVTADDLETLERRLMEAMGPTNAPIYTPPPLSAPISSNAPSPSSRQLTEDERKKALARKLRYSQPNLRIPSQRPPATPSASIPPKEQLAEQLKRQYRATAHLNQLSGLLAEADDAMNKGDPVRASNALRTAQTLAPQDHQIAERLAEVQTLAATALASTYLKQGEYEEKSGRFEAAARSYERAARGMPQASTWESAARCLLEAGGDLRAASDFARRSVALAPERSSSHLISGRIFMAAQMHSSALAELERARSLDPNNDTVTALLKRLERESF